MKPRILMMLIMLLSAMPAMAQQESAVTLKVGDSAPPLLGRRWVKGEPVRAFERGNVYVIEMWAMWCSPCIAAIPHLSRIQEEFADDGVVVIGQNIWEDDPADVAPFVRRMGQQMAYRVVMDDTPGGNRGRMAAAWMDAAGQKGIPCAFVVDRDGKLAWIGHPLAVEPVLKQMIEGQFNAQQAADEQAALTRLEDELRKATVARQWDRALELLDDFEKAQTAGPLRERTAVVRFHLLLQNRKYDDAYAMGDGLMEKFKDDFSALNEISWTILDEPGLEKRDLDLAEKMAIRAVELSKREDAAILDTLARAHFEKGEIDQAIELQTEAMNKSPESLKRMFEATLERYRKAKESGK